MKNRIKIIKAADRDAQQEQKEASKKQENAGQKENVSPVNTATIIASWIGEFRQKKSSELTIAYALKNSLTKPA
jgi:hypothetical protein